MRGAHESEAHRGEWCESERSGDGDEQRNRTHTNAHEVVPGVALGVEHLHRRQPELLAAAIGVPVEQAKQQAKERDPWSSRISSW